MALADWIMGAATSNPPRGRERWAEAMRAEYASLSGGQFSWALGCFTTMLGWRLRADAVYFALLATTIVVLMTGIAFWVEILIPRDVIRSGFYAPLVELFPACLLLSLYRPSYAYLTAFAIFLLPNIYGYIAMYADGWFIAPHSEARITIHDAPQLVGLMADVGGCLSGALLGRAIRRSVRQPRRAMSTAQ